MKKIGKSFVSGMLAQGLTVSIGTACVMPSLALEVQNTTVLEL